MSEKTQMGINIQHIKSVARKKKVYSPCKLKIQLFYGMHILNLMNRTEGRCTVHLMGPRNAIQVTDTMEKDLK